MGTAVYTLVRNLLSVLYQRTKEFLALDDLLPIFTYIVVRAQIRQLGAEIHFIKDLMDRSLDQGLYGNLLTTLLVGYIAGMSGISLVSQIVLDQGLIYSPSISLNLQLDSWIRCIRDPWIYSVPDFRSCSLQCQVQIMFLKKSTFCPLYRLSVSIS